MRQQYSFILGLSFAVLLFITGCNKAQSPSDQSVLGSMQSAATATAGGVRIEKPFQRQFSGAECYRGIGSTAGNVGFGFPNRSDRILAFSLGPLPDGHSPGQENNKPYNGAGTYPNIGIVLKSPDGIPIVGFGTVTVNPDLQTGSFVFNDGKASGTWDCGHKL